MRKSDKDKEGLLYLNFQFSKPVSSKKTGATLKQLQFATLVLETVEKKLSRRLN